VSRILVLGCGSIGQRHIRNLLSLNADNILVFDTDQEKLREVKNISLAIETSDNLSLLWKKNPEIAFIAVPTSLHLKYALMAARRGCHLFIEKPLSHNTKGINYFLSIIRKNKLITLVGCNMRFYWAISEIKKLVDKEAIGRIISARIEAGQYLPDWRPGQDYSKSYSARKKLGGGVILDAIHEIDYAQWIFGDIKNVISMYGKLTTLKIDTEDTAEVFLKFTKGPLVNIHMDYIQRFYSRSCKVIGEKGTIKWSFTKHCLQIYLARTKKWKEFLEPKKYNLNQMYVDQIKYFLSCVKRKRKTFNDVFSAFKTLQTTLEVKRKGVIVKY